MLLFTVTLTVFLFPSPLHISLINSASHLSANKRARAHTIFLGFVPAYGDAGWCPLRGSSF